MNGLFILVLVYQAAIAKTISYSLAVVLLTSAKSLAGTVVGVVELLPAMMENALYIDKIRQFLGYESKVTSIKNLAAPQKLTLLEADHIFFHYDGAQMEIIRDLTLKIRPGEHIAVVGYNGAGKTTLIKLLMRLYDVTDGTIWLDGMPIRDYNVESYRRQFGAVFQDFKLYAGTLRENILMDDPELLEEGREQDKAIYRALEESGFSDRVAKMKKGLDTQLLSEFDVDGEELSGGEQQKIAVARVFYSNANIIIMDEPSSALDPISEYQLNQTMKHMAAHKTVIYISHRLSTTRDADRIIMLENGEIVESGTHEELLALNGKYANMWYMQAGRYQYLESATMK